MRKYLRSLFISIFTVCMALAQLANAQTRVTGKVVDADTKEPLTGASVTVKGTPKSASAGLDGSFKIDVSGTENPVLVISYIGYVSKEVPVAGTQSLGEITLK